MPTPVVWTDENGIQHPFSELFTKDGYSGEQVVMLHIHHTTHEGQSFTSTYANDMSIDNVLDIQVRVPNDPALPHLSLYFTVEAETEWWVYEDVNVILEGTEDVSRNNNRESENISKTKAYWIVNTSTALANADTAVAAATLLHYGVANAGKGRTGAVVGGISGEMILKRNTDYTFRFDATAAGWIDWQVDWYESESKI